MIPGKFQGVNVPAESTFAGESNVNDREVFALLPRFFIVTAMLGFFTFPKLSFLYQPNICLPVYSIAQDTSNSPTIVNRWAGMKSQSVSQFVDCLTHKYNINKLNINEAR